MSGIRRALLLVAVFTATVCSAAQPVIIPKPLTLTSGKGVFRLQPSTLLVAEDAGARKIAVQLAKAIGPATGWALKVAASGTSGIHISTTDESDAVKTLGAEGYTLTVTPEAVRIRASSPAGAFYGMETLRQLLPVAIFSPKVVTGVDWTIPCVEVTDKPRFGWRGLMLDASRHFYNLDTTKRLLDLMALHKLNVFHWHLVDGHGWRVEIKKYPRLTSFGGFRRQPPIGRHGGFYTQDEIRDLVAYAKERHITVVPEIEMPGHSRAATAAYPFLACQDNGGEVAYLIGYPTPAKRFPKLKGSNVLCAGRESTFEFLGNVLTEVFDLFPSKFIHVGGDEVGKGFWKNCPECQQRMKKENLKGLHELQSYFMQRMEKFINKHGRRMIGWDEILEGGLAENAAVMSWRGERGGIKAAQMGHDVVMTPQKPLYFDHGQGGRFQPHHWPGEETLEEVYNYNPVPGVLTPEQGRHILGCQANVWGVFIHSDELIDCQVWPRGCALAETAWCPQKAKDLAAFKQRLKLHEKRLDLLNVSYYFDPNPEPVPDPMKLRWSPETTPKDWKTASWPITKKLTPGEAQAVTFAYRKGAHGLDVRKVSLKAGDTVISDDHQGFTGGRSTDNTWRFPLPKNAPETGWVLHAEIKGSGGTNSTGSISLRSGPAGDGRFPWKKPRIVPKLVTTTPVTHNRDKRIYDWMTRHKQIIERNKTVKPDIITLGDSITHYWAGEPKAPLAWGRDAWNRLYDDYVVTNMGCGWDRTENTLWRVRNGELDGIAPRLAVILLGTNNLAVKNTPREIYWGVQAVVDEIHKRCPKTKILLLGLLPRKRRFASTPERVNNLIATLNDRPYVRFYNANYELLDKDGKLRPKLYRDGVHVNAAGYTALANVLRPIVVQLTGK